MRYYTMKRRSLDPVAPRANAEAALCEALLSLKSVEEVQAFLRDLTTPAEFEALVDRWSVVPFLDEGVAYRDIHDLTAVSVTTIGRVARCLAAEASGYRIAIDRLKRKRKR
jgi:TrpR-related protein YerC/YecD